MRPLPIGNGGYSSVLRAGLSPADASIAYEEAIEWGEEYLKLVDCRQARLALSSANAQLDRADDANRQVQAILASKRSFSPRKVRSLIFYFNDDDRDHIIDGLRKSRLPNERLATTGHGINAHLTGCTDAGHACASGARNG